MTKLKTGDMLYYLQMRMHWVWLSCIGGGENLLSTQGACDIQRICKEWVVENMVKVQRGGGAKEKKEGRGENLLF